MGAVKDSETIQVGDVFTGGRQFTQQEVDLFCKVTRDRNPLHHDEEFARRSRFGRLIVPGLLVTSIFADVLSDWDLLATEVLIQFVGPVYVGDKVEITIEIDSRDGPHLSAKFCGTSVSGNPVIRGALKGMSLRSVAREN
jgi:3-hydroxybutyryl-CoA dehydratase